MIDISSARLAPFQAFHSFHESINVHIKVAHAAALLLVRHAGEPSLSDQLANLIAASHPSWNSPPVRNLSIDLQRAQDSAVSAFALMGVFSAFDDFLVSTEAEVSRCTGNRTTAASELDHQDSSYDDEVKIDRVFRLYASMNWNPSGISKLQPLLRYFRLCRNSIAHRNGRASKALALHSKATDLALSLSVLQESSERGVMSFDVNEQIHIPPTLAIMCSHLLRLIAIDANECLVRMLGLEGVLKSAVYHAVRLNAERGGKPRKRPEIVVNAYLTVARIRLDSRFESIVEMKRLGLWTQYLKAVS